MTASPAQRLAVLPLAGALLLGSVALALPASASPTANEIVYVVNDATASKVVIRNLLTRTEQVVLSAALSTGTSFDGPELSPDGSKVVLAKDTLNSAGDETEQLLVVARTTKAVTVLASNTSSATATSSTFDVLPTVSPDGTTVLWTHGTVTASPTPGAPPTVATELRTAPISGNAVPTTVNGSAGTAAGAYRPDGTAIVVTTPTAAANSSEGPLSLLDPATGTLTALNSVGDEPVFSPDSSTIAIDKTVGTGTAAHTVIATLPATGGPSTTLPATASSSTSASTPGWSPDGESLTYDLLNNIDSTSAVWATDRAGVRAGKVAGSASADASTPAFNGPAPTAVSTDGVASTFTPVTPTRLLDTRTTNGGHLGKVGAGGSVTLTVAGRVAGGTTIPADATALVLNVTVANGTLPTVVRVYPAPVAPVAATSSLNTTKAGQVLANQVTVKLPASAGANAGKVVLYNGAGTVDLLADVAGFYSATASDKFQPIDPRRILDSRNGTGTPAAPFTTDARAVQVTGTGLPVSGGGTVDIPATATAVVLNVTATAPTENTYVRVFPQTTGCGPLPTVSSVNLPRGQTGANLVTVKVGSGGRVCLQNFAGTVQLLADIAGYYDPAAPGLYVPVTPIRFLDTRSGTGAAPIPTTAGGYVDLLVAGTRGIPTTALAAVLNLTGTAPTTPTIVRAYPSTSATVPTVSNLNLVKADSRANAAVVKPGTTGRVRILNGAGSVQLIADVAGYFVPGP